MSFLLEGFEEDEEVSLQVSSSTLEKRIVPLSGSMNSEPESKRAKNWSSK